MYPRHATDGFVISGSLQVTPPLSNDDAELLQAVGMTSLRATLEGVPSAVAEKLAPGHPDGPSGWQACEDGCCLEMAEHGFVRLDAIEPWLAYLVGTLFIDHTFAGSLMLWDGADRTFTALTVDGTRVRRREVLQQERTARKRSRATVGPRLIKSV